MYEPLFSTYLRRVGCGGINPKTYSSDALPPRIWSFWVTIGRERWGNAPVGIGVADPEKHASPNRCYHAEFSCCKSKCTCVVTEIRRKRLVPSHPGLSRSLKVIGTDTDQSATYDFLLVVRDNYEPISCGFRNKRCFRWKIAIFPIVMHLAPPLRSHPWNFKMPVLLIKLEWWPYQVAKTSLTVLRPTLVLIQYQRWTDMDGQNGITLLRSVR